jgi:hypothetical protein
MENKSIDINQRIPLDVLYAALESYLNESYTNEYILEQLRLEFKGENRLKKALRIVNKIIIKNPLNNFIIENRAEITNAIKKKVDRDIILIALLNSSFRFSYDVMKTFGKFFSVQDVINTETIKKPISNIYGGNRATENGIYSVVPMFIEAGFFKRPKPGVYEFTAKLNLNTGIAYKIYVESFLINNKIEQVQEYQLSDPYFLFLNQM